jgi:hypothetical protein
MSVSMQEVFTSAEHPQFGHSVCGHGFQHNNRMEPTAVAPVITFSVVFMV